MSKSVRRILPIVAAIAVPFAAPAIAAKIGLSAALGGALGSAAAGTVAGSALTGAALGAGTAALTGQRIGRGALMGGLAGGVGGFLQGPPQVAGVTPPGAPAIGSQSLSGLGGPAVTGYSTPAAVTGAGAVPGTGVLQPGLLGVDTASRAAQAAAAGGQAPTGFMQALREVPGAVADRFRDPQALADLTLRAGGMLAGSAIAGDGLSPQERRLLQAQEEELRWLQENNQAEFQRRLAEAQQLLGEARYFDPEYFGLQAARRQQMAGAVAQREGLRGLSPQQRQEAQRRMQLETARGVGTAYDVGFGTGVQARTQLQQAGLQALPSPSAFSTGGGFGQLAQAYGGAQQQGRQEAMDIGRLFGAVAPGISEEERRRREEEERRRREQAGGP